MGALQPWHIAIIVIILGIAVATVTTTVWAIKRSRRQSRQLAARQVPPAPGYGWPPHQ